ncbi:DNA/RNA helicase domain-containing protein [Leptotrichia shahii]
MKNSYYVLLTRGIKGLYIYIKDSELKKYFMENLKF